MIVRILPHLSADGPAQMGLDEALLESVSKQPAAAVLRTYEWSVPTLSLGYFQSYREVESAPRWRGVPVVRRMTGGGAIWHHHEMTYALIVPRSHPLAGRPVELYRAVHGVLAELLREAGVAARRRGEEGPLDLEKRPFLCFTGRDGEDIVANGWKVVGSAQRRRPKAVLQHGSLLLAGSERTPELPGLGEVADVTLSARAWSFRLCRRLPGVLGLSAREEEITAFESARSAVLAREVYENPDWTRRR
jgi:lipoate-protein ligase A